MAPSGRAEDKDNQEWELYRSRDDVLCCAAVVTDRFEMKVLVQQLPLQFVYDSLL